MDESSRYIFVFLFICAGIGIWMINSTPPKKKRSSAGPVSPRTWVPYDDSFEREMAEYDKLARRRAVNRNRRVRLALPKSYRRDKALADLTEQAYKYVALFGWDGKSKKARRAYAVLAHVRKREAYKQQWRT